MNGQRWTTAEWIIVAIAVGWVLALATVATIAIAVRPAVQPQQRCPVLDWYMTPDDGGT